MKTTWNNWCRARLLPFPGDAWVVDVELRRSEATIAAAGGGVVPGKPKLATEIKRGAKLRLNERYNIGGNHPRDSLGRDLVDVWVARAGLVFAAQATLGACTAKRDDGRPYILRLDGQPWGRLREHLFADPDEVVRAEALGLLTKAFDATDASELPYALAYATCDRALGARMFEIADELAYGQTCLLATVTEPRRAKAALKAMIAGSQLFQLIEEAYPHLPNLMRHLADADADLVVKAARLAWNLKVRKPWFSIAQCVPTAAARKFLKEFADTIPPNIEADAPKKPSKTK